MDLTDFIKGIDHQKKAEEKKKKKLLEKKKIRHTISNIRKIHCKTIVPPVDGMRLWECDFFRHVDKKKESSHLDHMQTPGVWKLTQSVKTISHMDFGGQTESIDIYPTVGVAGNVNLEVEFSKDIHCFLRSSDKKPTIVSMNCY